MPWFFMRRRQWLTRVVWVQYFLDGIAGQGIIDGLSPSGSCITGNRPVSVGMALALQMFVPGDPEPLLIDRATVVWVKGSEFGVYFDTPTPKVAEQLTTVISKLWSRHNMTHSTTDKSGRQVWAPPHFWTGRPRSRIT